MYNLENNNFCLSTWFSFASSYCHVLPMISFFNHKVLYYLFSPHTPPTHTHTHTHTHRCFSSTCRLSPSYVNNLWLTILDYMDQFLHLNNCDLLYSEYMYSDYALVLPKYFNTDIIALDDIMPLGPAALGNYIAPVQYISD